MQRDIKFRVYDNQIKGYRSLGTIQLSQSGKTFILIPDESYGGLNAEAIEDVVVEFFTGLKDKNGKDIYEGDILLDPHKIKGIVKFLNGSFKNESIGAKQKLGFGSYSNKCEVIGNIHKNPELL